MELFSDNWKGTLNELLLDVINVSAKKNNDDIRAFKEAQKYYYDTEEVHLDALDKLINGKIKPTSKVEFVRLRDIVQAKKFIIKCKTLSNEDFTKIVNDLDSWFMKDCITYNAENLIMVFLMFRHRHANN